MRLWHQDLLADLPRQQLLGQHRECCALRGKGWGRPHATVNYVFAHPPAWLVAYHGLVMDEMVRRGFSPTPTWRDPAYRGARCAPWRPGELGQWVPEEAGGAIYPEHDGRYLQECLENLAVKGVHL